MITIQRPGQIPKEIEYVLIDFEGTLASDRRVHPKAKDRINLLSKRTKIYIMAKEEKERVDKSRNDCRTDTRPRVEEDLRRVKAEIVYFTEGEASKHKLDLLLRLGATRVVVIGNGMDDASMMEEASFGIAVIGKEGTSVEVLRKADIVFTNILDAIDFLLKPLRQKATLGI